jgi:hypothetical protein
MTTATLPPLGTMTRRVLGVYDAATDSQRFDGTHWYPNALAFVLATSRLYSVPHENVAVALAHMSPRVHWVRNKRMTTELLRDGDTVGLRGAIERAKHALTEPFPLNTLKGPKTSAFARNVLGDTQPVTVDVHAASIALGEYPKNLKGKRYETIARAYVNAAKLRGIEPSEMQAITWVAFRGRAS